MKEIRTIWYVWLSWVLVRIHRVDCQELPTIRGKLFIRNQGKILIGRGVTINSNHAANPIGGQTFCSLITRKGSIVIQDGAGISNSTLFSVNRITIGKNVRIGGDCKIYDTDFHSTDYEERIHGEDRAISRPVTIKEGAFIGGGTTILKGVTIGMHCVVGAGSIVTKSIPDYQLWSGNPARFIRDLHSEGERHDQFRSDLRTNP